MPGRKKRGRPRKPWNNPPIVEDLRLQIESVPVPAGRAIEIAMFGLVDATEKDFEVLNHYMSNTSMTLGHIIWNDKVPLLGFRSPAVSNLMFALSSIHLAILRPDQSLHYCAISERYSTEGLRQLISLVPALNKGNCDAVFISSVFLCFIHLAKARLLGQTVTVEPGHEIFLSWWQLLRGVRVVKDMMGMSIIFAGILGPKDEDEIWPRNPNMNASTTVPLWQQSLERVSVLVSRKADHDTTTQRQAFDALCACFLSIYGCTNETKSDTSSDEQLVIEWMEVLDPTFAAGLRKNRPVHLLLLAHYAVLLKKLQFKWYMGGWAEGILRSVEETLDGQYMAYLQWPQDEVSRLGMRAIAST